MYGARKMTLRACHDPDGLPIHPSRFRILLADDNVEILEHVSRILQAHYDVIGKISDGTAVCSEVCQNRPDLVVLDISMGKCSGIEVARRLREKGYTGEILFLSVHEDSDFVSAALGAGGLGYVTKYRMGEDLERAVEATLSHQIFISSPLRQQ